MRLNCASFDGIAEVYCAIDYRNISDLGEAEKAANCAADI